MLEYRDCKFEVALPIAYVPPADGKMLPATVSPPLTVPPVLRKDVPKTLERAAAVGAFEVLADVQEFWNEVCRKFDPFGNK